MNYAPIVLFVYNRPQHAILTIEALKKNKLARESILYVFSDAPKGATEIFSVQKVRDFINNIQGFKSVNIVERNKNMGLANSIIDGVTKVCDEHGKVIVVEDDLVTSPYFLSYMNDALNLYEHNERVISIHGYVYPVEEDLPETFFLPGADCWGWATWRRGWALFNSDGETLLDELKSRKLIKNFDFNGSHPYSKMLEGQIKGANNSWAVRWYASAFLANKLTLYPGRSLVHNIGNDNSGTHCGTTRNHDSELSQVPIELIDVKVEPSIIASLAFERFFLKQRPGIFRRKLVKMIALCRKTNN